MAVINWEFGPVKSPRVELNWYLMACNADEASPAAGAPSNQELIDTDRRPEMCTFSAWHGSTR